MNRSPFWSHLYFTPVSMHHDYSIDTDELQARIHLLSHATFSLIQNSPKCAHVLTYFLRISLIPSLVYRISQLVAVVAVYNTVHTRCHGYSAFQVLVIWCGLLFEPWTLFPPCNLYFKSRFRVEWVLLIGGISYDLLCDRSCVLYSSFMNALLHHSLCNIGLRFDLRCSIIGRD